MNPRAASGKGGDYVPTRIEELASVLTHLLPIFFFTYYTFEIFKEQDEIVSGFSETFSVVSYGISMNILFGVSSAYHVVCFWYGRNHDMSKKFRVFDHATIYLFVAASYTPWLALVDLGMGIGSSVAVVVWTFCMMGLCKQFLSHLGPFRFLENFTSVFLLNVMGWSGILFIPSALTTATPVEALLLLILGGLFFSFGCIFLVWGNGIIPFSHAIWHFAVFLGVLAHFTAMYAYLLNLDSIYHPSHKHSTLMLNQIAEIFAGKHIWNYPQYFLSTFYQKM